MSVCLHVGMHACVIKHIKGVRAENCVDCLKQLNTNMYLHDIHSLVCLLCFLHLFFLN